LKEQNPLRSLSSLFSENTYKNKSMGVRLPVVALAKQIVRRSALTASRAASTSSDVPRGFFAVYVGEKQMQRFVVPVSYLNQPSFQDLLRKAEEEFGFNHPTGGLTIPCRVDTFIDVTSHLSSS
jgi:SAUR family protein